MVKKKEKEVIEKIAKEFAELIINVVKDPKHPERLKRIVKMGHISPKMLTPENLLKTKSATLGRIVMNIAMDATPKEVIDMFMKACEFTIALAEMEDGTPEAINEAHAGENVGCCMKKKEEEEEDKE